MIIVIFFYTVPWKGIIGYDALQFDLKRIDGERGVLRDSLEEIILDQTGSIDTSHMVSKKGGLDWSESCDNSKKELSLKILCKWSASDSNVIFYDRFYSLANFDTEHLEEIKKNQRRINMTYYAIWWLSVLSNNTSELKNIPLGPLGFDPNNIEVNTK